MASQNPIVHPTEVEWQFGGKTYVQEELSIYGEIRLAQVLAGKAVELINDGFPVERLADVVKTDPKSGEEIPDLALIADLAQQALGIAPSLAVDTSLVMLGVFPKFEDGTPNPEYDELRVALQEPKGGLKFSMWVDMVETFAQQNDLKRLVAPFLKLVRMTNQIGTTETPAVEEPTSLTSSSDSTSSPPVATARPKRSSGGSR